MNIPMVIEGLEDALNAAGEIELEFAGTVIGGPPGPKGESAYVLAQEHGFTGTEAEWLAGLKATDGEDGEDGEDGVSPTIQMGSVTTTAPGSAAEATLTGTFPHYSLNLKLPRGINGDDGDTGPQGLPGTGTATVYRSPDFPPNTVGNDGDFWFVLK